MTSILNSVTYSQIFGAGSEDEVGQRACESEEEKRRKDDVAREGQ